MKVIVIGGGPAGIMAAITARKAGNEVILLEKMRSIGRKLAITGKGRCNVTNAIDISEFIKNIPGNGKFLYSVFNQYTNLDLINYLEKLGVKTKVERGQRVFPVSDDAFEIVNALKREIEKLEIKLIVNSRVLQILTKDNSAIGVRTDNNKYFADKIILATGGKSYPLTGSTGDGYELAKELGHTIVTPKGSLVPLELYEKNDLQGLSLKNIAIKLKDKEKELYNNFGEIIFTNFGISGPLIICLTGYIIRVEDIANKFPKKEITLSIDLKPALSHEKLDERIRRDFEKYTRKQFKNCLGDLLPAKLIPYIVKMSGINAEKQVDQINKEERKKLVDLLKNLQFTVKAFRPVEEAIVTAGGISTKEINPSTMESKLISNLYFAGEVIDVDAYTGGFNLQIAFSTGYVAGCTL